jgi:hypothetical protein
MLIFYKQVLKTQVLILTVHPFAKPILVNSKARLNYLARITLLLQVATAQHLKHFQ